MRAKTQMGLSIVFMLGATFAVQAQCDKITASCPGWSVNNPNPNLPGTCCTTQTQTTATCPSGQISSVTSVANWCGSYSKVMNGVCGPNQGFGCGAQSTPQVGCTSKTCGQSGP